MNKRPIIITGCPRTGTRLVARILGGHSDHFLITELFKKSQYKAEILRAISTGCEVFGYHEDPKYS